MRGRRNGRVLAFAAAAVIVACGAPTPGAGGPRAPAGSLFAAAPDLESPLPLPLTEISGLATGPDGRVWGHNDERGVITAIDPATGATGARFAVGDPAMAGDFEGLAIVGDGTFYLVDSAGLLTRFSPAPGGGHAAADTIDTGLAATCEVEGLAWLRATDSLILACKTMRAPAMRDTVALYAWSIRDGALGRDPWLALPATRLARAAGVEGFHPASVEIDPATGRVILIAGRERAMAEIDPASGAILSARALGDRHPQPEGSAILADGALVIADEGPRRGGARFTRYPRVP